MSKTNTITYSCQIDDDEPLQERDWFTEDDLMERRLEEEEGK